MHARGGAKKRKKKEEKKKRRRRKGRGRGGGEEEEEEKETRPDLTKKGIPGGKLRKNKSFHTYTPIFINTCQGHIKKEEDWRDMMGKELRF